MAQTKSLDTLIKLETQAIDQLQKIIKELRDTLEGVEQEILSLKESLKREAKLARESTALSRAYSTFSVVVHEKIEELEQRRTMLEEQIERELDKMRDLFANRKRLEIIRDNKIKREAIEIETKKQKEMADLVMSKYTISLEEEENNPL